MLDGMEPPSLQMLVDWYRKTYSEGKGDREELVDLPDDDPVWNEVCAGSETCLGKKCPDRENCFISRMKATAAGSDLMVANHHLLISDLAVRETGFGEVIPRYESVIIDEAHGLEDAATQHFGFHLTYSKFLAFARDLRSEASTSSSLKRKFSEPLSIIEETARRIFFTLVNDIPPRRRLEKISVDLSVARDSLSSAFSNCIALIQGAGTAKEELRSLAVRAQNLDTEISVVLNPEIVPEYACWADRKDRGVMLHASPIEIGNALRTSLYDKISGTVFTSATLSAGGSFNYFKSRIGLANRDDCVEVILDSPFDYANQTVLYVPKHIPEPNDAHFTEALVPVLKDLLSVTQGRAFILFTSLKNMELVHNRLRDDLPFPILIQGSKPKSALLNEFRTCPNSVLFGSASFWEGVDIQGETLSCVVIDRLPFAPPDDPVVSARIQNLKGNGVEPFYSFQVPMAVLALKQGLGRLIRTGGDFGVLCVLDTRIMSKSYGRIFIKSLPNYPIQRDLKQVEKTFHSMTNSGRLVSKNVAI
jgi:ATP-dependent DNA helicase DinG